ncbi:MAG: acetoacetate--CoA ligase [Candidatus Marinimicrobia bacterium]|jgi:acetoacetyl-CoA synthetase|nr:acetoacetate--CoA ligase [Candidatus Neomarinimicrobiota bacterium]
MQSIMWQPTEEQINNSQMMAYMQFVNQKFQLSLKNYSQLYDWSIERVEDFWGSFWEYSKIIYNSPYSNVVDDITKMPGAKWFEGATLNFAENLLRHRDNKIAIQFYGEEGTQSSLSYRELYDKVSRLAESMCEMGIVKNDRVVGFMPNIPETVIAMLATASIGAIWSSCSPDFGIKGVLDRFKQIEPKLIFTADGYWYNGKQIDCTIKIKEILTDLPSIKKTVIIPFAGNADVSRIQDSIQWEDIQNRDSSEIKFEPLPFDHPLYIMYSSGTTGLPKSIVHSAGGTLVQHRKELQLHTDLTEDDKIFYFTTCGWMMWNWLVSSLSVGASIVLYDGSPFYPDGLVLLKMAKELGITILGTSAKYISSLESFEIKPNEISSFPKLRTILSTGSPLVEENFDFVYREWKEDVQLASISGGTDIISCFALGNPILPVVRGELQCRGLGMKVEAYNEFGKSEINSKGELVCSQAFPSMPIYFWNDSDGEKYHLAYFNTYPGIWHHGDYLEINDCGGVKIYGRSDTTLNPGGVRIGTAEIYQTVERFSEVEDSLVIGQPWGNDERIILFLKMKDQSVLSEKLIKQIKKSIRESCSPRHIPAKIISVADIPYTINGKKVELAVKQVIQNIEVKNKDSLVNKNSLEFYKNMMELKE